jgi:fatty-acyl-CoA synthase
MLTHHGLVNNVLLYTARCGLQSEDRMVTAMPFFHTAGCVLNVLGALVRGATLIPLIAFDPEKELELVTKEKATYLVGVPTMLIAMLNHPRFRDGEFDTSSLRWVGSGGTPVPVILMEQVKAQMGADSMIVFGMTETSPIITQTLPDDSFRLKSATVGTPLAHTEVKIVDPRTGEPAGFGESGELLTRGYLVMKGYYKMPEKTAETIDDDGWLRTGDLATMNERGYVNIVGRVKDMVIRGGENLFPAEIEAFLMRHSKIAEAQVVGVPDAFMGEEMCALVRLKHGESADEAEIRDYCRQGISRQKVPKYIKFVNE